VDDLVADLDAGAAEQARVHVHFGFDFLAVALLQRPDDVRALLVGERLGAGDAGSHDAVVLALERLELPRDFADELVAMVVDQDREEARHVLRDLVAGDGGEDVFLLLRLYARVRQDRAHGRVARDRRRERQGVRIGRERAGFGSRLEGRLGVRPRDGCDLGHGSRSAP